MGPGQHRWRLPRVQRLCFELWRPHAASFVSSLVFVCLFGNSLLSAHPFLIFVFD
jgi:hypothetical protein